MTDGVIGREHITVPDLTERVIAYRTLNYVSGPQASPPGTPNEFKIDVLTGKMILNVELIEQKRKDALRRGVKSVVNPKLPEHGALMSPSHTTFKDPWEKDMVAECKLQAHKAPHGSCQCGLYCYYDLDVLNCSASYARNTVNVCVAVDGNIEAHNKGMRAERMRIEAIYALSYAGLAALLEEMEVEFVPMESYTAEQFHTHCLEYGSELPTSMRAGIPEIPF